MIEVSVKGGYNRGSVRRNVRGKNDDRGDRYSSNNDVSENVGDRLEE
jgi:hypothetical protein